MAVHLDLPLSGTLRDDSRIVTDADRARLPGARSSGALAGLADALLVTPTSDDLSMRQVGA